MLTPNSRYLLFLLDVLDNVSRLNTIFITYSNSASNREICQGAIEYVSNTSLQIVGVYVLGNTSDQGLNAAINEAQSLNPDVFIACLPTNRGQAIVANAYAMNFRPRVSIHFLDFLVLSKSILHFTLQGFYVSSVPADESFISGLGADAYHIMGTSQWQPGVLYSGDFLFDNSAGFRTLFESRYPNETVNFRHASAVAGKLH